MARKDRNANGRRVDTVFVRKSGPTQAEAGQIANVRSMLKELGVSVPDDYWFLGTVSRRKVKTNADFLRLMEMVEQDRVSTVYVESQDRWGTKDRPELFSLLGMLRQHNTRLFDLRASKDLTENDLATELLAFVGSVKSQKELEDIAYRSLRTRVNFFLETGSWPTGTHPFGFGKVCYGPDGKTVKWVWQPVNRTKGQVFYASATGLTPGPANVNIPRKDRRDIVKLVLSNNPEYVRAVRLIYDLYTRVGLSRRQIAVRLNSEGLLFNGGPFAHTNITDILRNPAYAGDTFFGKVQTGELYTFDGNGRIIEVKQAPDTLERESSRCLVMRDTHEPLVDRKTWELAQKKLNSERDRTSHAPRNPAYYLKQVFVCGHCGKSMVPRTENASGGKKTIVYVCSTYLSGRQNGQSVACGYQRITHEDAERLLLDKIKEMNLPFEEVASEGARANLQERLARLGDESDDARERWWAWLCEGVDALLAYLKDAYGLKGDALRTMEYATKEFYRLGGKVSHRYRDKLPIALAKFKKAVHDAERAAVREAEEKLAELQASHRLITLRWVQATDEMQDVLKREIEGLEEQIHDWKPRTLALSERFKRLHDAEAERQAERERLTAEWPTIENREKGEALRRLFHSVRLYWDRTFHAASPNPTRARKTGRPGRYSYALQRDRTEWHFSATDSVSSW